MNTLRYFDFGAARPVLLLIARIAVVLIFIIFGFPKMMGFDGTVQYMASLGAPMPMLAAIIAVVMEVPAAILIVLGFFTRPLAVLFIFYTLGTAVIGHHYWDMTGDAVGPNMLDIRINDEIPDYYIAHLLTKNKRILCAAPEYLQKYPQPQSLQELSRHDCLVTKERDMTHGIWELGNGQEKKSVKVSGHLSSNSGEIVLQWALEGKGIMLRSEWDVLPFLESGKLVQVLPEYAQSANIWAVYREPLYRSMKLRVCVEFLAAWCQQRLGKPDEGYQVM